MSFLLSVNPLISAHDCCFSDFLILESSKTRHNIRVCISCISVRNTNGSTHWAGTRKEILLFHTPKAKETWSWILKSFRTLLKTCTSETDCRAAAKHYIEKTPIIRTSFIKSGAQLIAVLTLLNNSKAPWNLFLWKDNLTETSSDCSLRWKTYPNVLWKGKNVINGSKSC